MKDLQSEFAPFSEDKSANNQVNWGMLENCRILRRGQRGAFTLSLDEARLRFRYVLRRGQPYFTHVQID